MCLWSVDQCSGCYFYRSTHVPDIFCSTSGELRGIGDRFASRASIGTGTGHSSPVCTGNRRTLLSRLWGTAGVAGASIQRLAFLRVTADSPPEPPAKCHLWRWSVNNTRWKGIKTRTAVVLSFSWARPCFGVTFICTEHVYCRTIPLLCSYITK